MEEIKKFDKYLLVVTTVEKVKEDKNEKEELIKSNRYLAKKNGDIAKEKDVIISEKDGIIKIKDKEIRKLQEEVSKYQRDGLDLAAKLSTVKLELEENIKSVDKKIATAKGGYTKEINKQKAIITAQEETIKTYTQKLEESDKKRKELEEKNKNQEEQISKLLSEKKHIPLEYINDGLPKQSKQALSNVIKKKNEEKGEMLKVVEKNLETTIKEFDSMNVNTSSSEITTEVKDVVGPTVSVTVETSKNKKNLKKKKRNKR